MSAGLLFFACALAYAMGGIPVGPLVARRQGDFDLRAIGSGNIGATNVYRALGLKWAVAVFAGDALKGFIPVIAARALLLPPHDVMLVAVFAVLGHVVTPFMRLRGGKGVSTAFGAMVALVPLSAVLALLAWAAVSFKTRLVSLGSLAAAAVLPLVTLATSAAPAYKIGAFALAGLVVFAHRENIKRLRAGEEKPVKRDWAKD